MDTTASDLRYRLRPSSMARHERHQHIDGDLRRSAAMEAGLKPARATAGQDWLRKAPGFSLAYLSDGRFRWLRTYGVTDVAQPCPVSPGTRFEATSLTKAVAATVALYLVEGGALQLCHYVGPLQVSWKMSESEPSRDWPDAQESGHKGETTASLITNCWPIRG